MKKAENFIPFVSMVHENKDNGHQTSADAPARLLQTCRKVYHCRGDKTVSTRMIERRFMGFISQRISALLEVSHA